MRNVLVTGLPRSGLTLASALIDRMPDTVCLNEPGWQMRQDKEPLGADAYCQWLIEDFAQRRSELIDQTPLPDLRSPDGTPLTDGIHDPKQPRNAHGRAIPVMYMHPKLPADFTLTMKHHTLYTALLPELARSKQFTIIAIIRHPLDVILSWQRQCGSRPYMQGFIPDSFHEIWPEAARVSFLTTDIIERMVHLYDMYCQRYYESRQHIHILTYEELIKNPHQLSSIIGAKKHSTGEGLIERRSLHRPLAGVEELRARIEKYGVFAKHFYSV